MEEPKDQNPTVPPAIIPGEMYTTEGLAARLQIEIRTVRRYVNEGRLPAVKFGSRFYFKGSDVIAAIRKGGKEFNAPGDWG